MTLEVDVAHRQGGFELQARFASSGRLLALFGSSGSGKTTLINLIAGLAKPLRGRIVSDGRVLADTATGVFLPPHRRRIGYVFQDSRLFPHLTVEQNLRYGGWFATGRTAAIGLDAVVELLGIRHLLKRKPLLLSGGETQRVAIGRALLSQPQLILMDEPLASLDPARRAEVLPYIERLRDQARVPIVYVSHSVAEVARLATDMVALREGRMAAFGPPNDVLQRLGVLPLEEQGEGGAVLQATVVATDARYGLATLRLNGGAGLRVADASLQSGDRLRLRIRARDVMIAQDQPSGLSALNCLAGQVVSLEGGAGPLVDLLIDCSGDRIVARVTRLSVDTLGLRPGLPVFAIIKSVSFDAATTTRTIAGL